MSERGIRAVPLQEFDSRFTDAGIVAKRRDGLLLEIIVDQRPATNPAYTGGSSLIIKLVTASGQHIATIHEIAMPDGSVAHTHGKDYTLRDCSRIRPLTG